MRLAIGASRSRLVRQLLTESVLISLTGGAAGVLLATVHQSFRPQRFDCRPTSLLLFDLRTDWRVLTFTLVLSIATGILFSLIPALQSSRPQLVPALEGRIVDGGLSPLAFAQHARRRAGQPLVSPAHQRGLDRAQSAGRADACGPASIRKTPSRFRSMSACKATTKTRGRAFQQQVLERARALPQIENAALTDYLPLGLNYNDTHDLYRRRGVQRREHFADRGSAREQPRILRGHGHSAARPRFS